MSHPATKTCPKATRRGYIRGLVWIVALLLPLSLFACSRTAEQHDKKNPTPNESGAVASYRIDCGGGAVGPFSADKYATGGDVFSTGTIVSTAGVANAAPPAVYQSERFGNHSYTFPNLTPDSAYTVRLHFAEIFYTSAGSRQFNVVVNGVRVLNNLDIFANVGANKALVRDFTTKASSSGQIVIQYISVKDNAKSNGVEILPGAQAVNQEPIINVPAAASPNPATGLTSTLSTLGADDAGESDLTYTWAPTGTPPGTVTFSVNGNNAAKSTKATFGQAGTYAVQVTIKDQGGLTATAHVNVIVGASGILTPIVQVHCGGDAVGSFVADQFFNGGSVHTTSNAIATNGVPNAAPAAVYQTQRYGDYTYTFSQLTAGSPYTVRLHFAETFWNGRGSRVFNVLINGVPALTNFDIFAAGGKNAAVVRDFSTTASPNGQILVQYVTVVDNAESSGIEILTADAAPVPAVSASAHPPAVASAPPKASAAARIPARH